MKKSRLNLCIIGDDLTGAADTGIQIAKRGIFTVLFPFGLKTAEVIRGTHQTQAIALNTSTRGLDQESAYSKVKKEAGLLIQSLDPHIIYKKIDSTLRGNPGIEIEAVMDASNSDVAIFAPAFPACGRTTIDGIHLVNGKPLAQTETANDPVCPVTESNISTILSMQTNLKVGHIGLKEIRSGTESLYNSISEHLKNGEKIIVFDSVTNNDLSTIAEASLLMPSPPLIVGSAGLADQLSRLIFPDGQISYPAVNRGINLVISGSLSSVTSDQLDMLEEVDLGQIIPINFYELLMKDGLEHLREIALAIISSTKTYNTMGFQAIRKRPYPSRQVQNIPLLISRFMGKLAYQIIKDYLGEIGNVFLIGGDTALAVFRELGISQVRLIDEILPGIPYGQAINGEFSGLNIVTKAGAFGEKNAIIKCIDFLENL